MSPSQGMCVKYIIPEISRRLLVRDFDFVAARHASPVHLVGGVLLAKLDGLIGRPHVYDAKVCRFAGLGLLPGEGPGVAVEVHFAGAGVSAVGGNLVAGAVVRVAAGEDEEDLWIAIHDLAAGEVGAALPAVVDKGGFLVAGLAVGSVEVIHRGFPCAGVGPDGVDARGEVGGLGCRAGCEQGRYCQQNGCA